MNSTQFKKKQDEDLIILILCILAITLLISKTLKLLREINIYYPK